MDEIFGDFTGAAVPLSDQDLDAIALEAGLEPAALRAVVAVEAAGEGFDADGRPKILFEPHVFYRLLPIDARRDAEDDGLAYPKWGMRPYPKGQDAQYDRLTRAMKIDRHAALKAASWGMGQIMGFNHRHAGYGDVDTFVLACFDSEANHIRMMVNFIRSTGLLDELKDRNWAGFARGYNGPGYIKNQYDVKLARAYARFSSPMS